MQPQASQPVQSRWARPNPANLVNTSLPAREAPTLVPGTLASLTRNPHATSAASTPSAPSATRTSEPYRRPTHAQRVIPSAEEFPSLGGLKTALPKKEPTRSYAEMSREWVKTAKEKEEEDKKRAEEERSQQTPEEIFRHRVISLAPLNATASTSTSASARKEYDGIGGTKEEWSDESDLSDPHVDLEVLSPSDEDPDEFNSNIVWDRRSKNEMY